MFVLEFYVAFDMVDREVFAQNLLFRIWTFQLYIHFVQAKEIAWVATWTGNIQRYVERLQIGENV